MTEAGWAVKAAGLLRGGSLRLRYSGGGASNRCPQEQAEVWFTQGVFGVAQRLCRPRSVRPPR